MTGDKDETRKKEGQSGESNDALKTARIDVQAVRRKIESEAAAEASQGKRDDDGEGPG